MEHDAPGRRWWLLLACGWAAFVLLGSWFPFRYQPVTLSDAWLHWWQGAEGRRPAAADVAINLLLGIPLGFFGFLCLLGWCRERALYRLPGAVLVVLVVAAVGLIAELGQNWCVDRVSSRIDTLAQLVGGILGTAAAWWGGRWFAVRAATALSGRAGGSAMQAWLDLYAAGYVLWMLMPFLPVLSPSNLKAKLHSGAVQLSLFSEWRLEPWQAAYTATVATTTAAPIGWWFARWLGAWRNRTHFATSMAAATLCVVMLEAAQIFIETRVMQVSDAFYSALGAAVGVLSVVVWPPSDDRHSIVNLSTAPAFALAAVLIAAVYILFAWAPFDWIGSNAELQQRLAHLRSSGFWTVQAGNDMHRATNLLTACLWSIPVGASAGMAAIRSRTYSRLSWTLVALSVPMICSAAELGQLFFRQASPNALELGARLAGGMVGVFFVWQATRRCARREASG